jgi:hypothetical protein
LFEEQVDGGHGVRRMLDSGRLIPTD